MEKRRNSTIVARAYSVTMAIEDPRRLRCSGLNIRRLHGDWATFAEVRGEVKTVNSKLWGNLAKKMIAVAEIGEQGPRTRQSKTTEVSLMAVGDTVQTRESSFKLVTTNRRSLHLQPFCNSLLFYLTKLY